MSALVALTGATGFLGPHLAQACLGAGHAVRAVVRDAPKARAALGPEIGISVAGLDDQAALRSAFAGADVVLHNAALAPGWTQPTAAAYHAANVLGVRNTLEAAAKAGIKRVVLVSTIGVHQPSLRTPLSERSPMRDPESRLPDLTRFTTDPGYVKSKARGEALAWRLASELGLDLVVLRPGPIIGPGDPKATLRYGRWLGRPSTFAPTARVPHLHAADAAQAAMLALTSPQASGRAFVLGGSNTSVYEVLHTLREAMGSQTRLIRIPVGLGVRIDDRQAQELLGWQPRSLHDSLADCAAWLRTVDLT